MNCHNCSKQIEKESKFCLHCGSEQKPLENKKEDVDFFVRMADRSKEWSPGKNNSEEAKQKTQKNKETLLKHIESYKRWWKKGKIGKVILIFLGILLLPLTLYLLWVYFSDKYASDSGKRKIVAIVLIIVALFTVPGWFGATLGAISDGKVGWGSASKKETPKEEVAKGNCIGPDGKRIQLSSKACEEFNNAWKNQQQPQGQSQPQIQQPTSAPAQTAPSEPTIAPNQSYDKNLGNNYIAAKSAQNIFDTINNAAPGAFTSIMLEASPEDPGGKSEEEYKKSVSSVFLQLRTTSTFWNSLDEDSRKDLVASFVTSTGNIFPRAYPHVYISNGVRTVAEGEYNFTRTEPKITLK